MVQQVGAHCVDGASQRQQCARRASCKASSMWALSQRRLWSSRNVHGQMGRNLTRCEAASGEDLHHGSQEVGLPAERSQELEDASADEEQPVPRGAGGHDCAASPGQHSLRQQSPKPRSSTIAAGGQPETQTEVAALTRRGKGGKGKDKGKGNGKDKDQGDKTVCFECGKPCRYARDCWQRRQDQEQDQERQEGEKRGERAYDRCDGSGKESSL